MLKKRPQKKSTVTLLRIVIPYFLTEYFCTSVFQRFTYCVDCKLLLAMVITFPDEAVRGVRRNANFQMSQIGRSVQLHCVCQIMFIAATERPNAHMLLLISAKSQLQLCHWEFPSLRAPTQTQPPTDGAQPAPVRETPPLSLSPCISLHLLCISLLPCRKKHNSFVV